MAPQRGLVSTSYRNLIRFIPGTEGESMSNDHTTGKRSFRATEKQGHEVRTFYEDLLNEGTHQKDGEDSITSPTTEISKTPDSHSERKVHRKRKKRLRDNKANCDSNDLPTVTKANKEGIISSEPDQFNFNQLNPKMRQHFKLLQSAQLGDLSNVKDLLTSKRNSDLDVNFRDFYGWTPLMCAAREGHVEVIKCFLKHGANRYISNAAGDTALSIAKNAGHLSVVSILESSNEQFDNKVPQRNAYKSSCESFHCDICKRDFSQKDRASHLTSTVHLFNSGHRPSAPSFYIPNSNRGFQMLLRSGWDEQCGLGPAGKGRKFPVKTVLKQDRAGFGGEDEKRKKAKVTHFDPGDAEAVKNKQYPERLISVRKAARNAARSEERRSRRWEQNLRFEMS